MLEVDPLVNVIIQLRKGANRLKKSIASSSIKPVWTHKTEVPRPLFSNGRRVWSSDR